MSRQGTDSFQTALSLQYTYATCITLVKISILLFYRGIFNLRLPWFKYCWYTNISLVAAYFIAICFRISFQCKPISLLWSLESTCSIKYVEIMVFGSLNAAIDLSILLLPIPMVWQLKMARRQKSTVTGIFGLGLLYIFP